jgi:hypothetical protein
MSSKRHLINGHARLNLSLVASIFNKFIGISLPSDEEIRALMDELDKLRGDNDSLRSQLQQKDKELEKLRGDVSAEKRRLNEDALMKETDLLSMMDQLKLVQSTEMDRLNVKYSLQLEKKDRQIEELTLSNKTQLQSIQDALAAKYEQQQASQERRHESEMAELKRDLRHILAGIDDFISEHGMAAPAAVDGSTPIYRLPGAIKDRTMTLFEAYYDKEHQVEEARKKLEHLSRVNLVIGDKIQEYAESVINDKKRSKKSAFGGIFS